MNAFLTQHADGVVLSIRAKPGARHAGIQGVHGTQLKVSLHAPPEKGKANEELLELLSKCLQVKANCLSLLSGQTSQNKKVLIRGIDLVKLEHRLQAAVVKH
ncbi:MAG: YggU family protein [Planctomycetia bacterium]|nr:YggU family protein [Planctomycetia bacterium]